MLMSCLETSGSLQAMQAGYCDARQKLTQAEKQRDAAQVNLDKACKATQEQGDRLGLVQQQLRAELLYQVSLVRFVYSTSFAIEHLICSRLLLSSPAPQCTSLMQFSDCQLPCSNFRGLDSVIFCGVHRTPLVS